jgi:hypothetical protein
MLCPTMECEQLFNDKDKTRKLFSLLISLPFFDITGIQGDCFYSLSYFPFCLQHLLKYCYILSDYVRDLDWIY